MKLIYSAFFLGLIILSSCTKTTNRGVEIEYRTDTVFAANDTTFVMDTAYWNAFSYFSGALVTPSDSTYFNTSEGLEIFNKNFRQGIRLQTKSEIGFRNKSIYYKWKVNGFGQFSFMAPAIKYDPYLLDSIASHGVYFGRFSTNFSYVGSYVVQDEVWYYTRVKPVTGTDNYEAITTTGNYENMGGVVVSTILVPVYTKSGFISFLHSDAYSTNAYAVLAECKISNN